MADIRPPSPEELSAYTDGELDRKRQAEIALYLSQRDEHDAMLSADAAILGGLRNLRERLRPEATPARLRKTAAAFGAVNAPRPRRRTAIAFGAIAAVALIAAALSILSRPDPALQQRRLAERAIAQAAAYYLRDVRGAMQFGAAAETELRRALPQLPDDIVDARFMPDTKYLLLGGRTLSLGGEGAVILFYEDDRDVFYGLTIWSETPPPHAPVISGEHARTIFWSDRGRRFALTANADAAALDAFKSALRAGYRMPE